MRHWYLPLLLAAAVLYGLAPCASAAPKFKASQTVRGLLYDLKGKKLYFCYKIRDCDNPTVEFNPDSHFFRTGDVLVLRLQHAKLLTEYSVQTDKVAVADATAVIRGMDDAAAVDTTRTQAGKGGIDQIRKNGLDPMLVGDYRKLGQDCLRNSLQDMQTRIRAIDTAEAKAFWVLQPTSVQQTSTIPGSTTRDLVMFARALRQEINKALKSDPYTDAEGFDHLAQRTDALASAVKQFKSAMSDTDKANAAGFAEATRQWAIYYHNLAEAGKLEDSIKQNIRELLQPLQRSSPADINELQALCFDGMNRLYLQSEQKEPLDISLGTFDANFQVFFHLYEKSKFISYAFQAEGGGDQRSQPPQAGQGEQDAGNGIDVNQPAPLPSGPGAKPQNTAPPVSRAPSPSANAAPDTSSAPAPQNGGTNKIPKNGSTPAGQASQDRTTQDPGKNIYNKWFTVHKIYHANLIGGYAVSAIRDRSFDLRDVPASASMSAPTGSGATGSQSAMKKIFQSNNSGAQTHYLVGLSYYLRHTVDMFPGHQSWIEPAVLIGAAPDAANNYYVGLNCETKVGVNIAGGLHIGQVRSLQRGYVEGDLTSASSAPTRTSPHGGAFVAIGFDYKVFLGLLNKVNGVKTAGAVAPASSSDNSTTDAKQ